MVKHTPTAPDLRGARYLIIYSIVILLVMTYFMVGSWPAATEDLDLNATSTFNHTKPAFNAINDINTTRIISFPPFGEVYVGPETLLVVVMMISGAMGACLFSIWAASHHLGKEHDFDYERYRAWYFTRPLLGAGIAFIFYLLVRGGLLTIGAQVMALNVVVIAGLSGLVGMFSEQAILKLLEVADALFGPSKGVENPEDKLAEEAEEAKKAADAEAEEKKKAAEQAKKKAAKATEKAEKAKQKANASKTEKDKEEAEKAAEEAELAEEEAKNAAEKSEKAAKVAAEEAAKADDLAKKKRAEVAKKLAEAKKSKAGSAAEEAKQAEEEAKRIATEDK